MSLSALALTPSIAISLDPFVVTARASHGQPLGDGVEVPVGPRTLFALAEQPADLVMLLVDRLLGVDGDEAEDQRQRLVFANDPRDEPLVARRRILDVGDVLTGLVEVRRARGGDALLDVPAETEK